MIHLLRSLFAGYFFALVGGMGALALGVGPVTTALGVWIGGSALSVVIAAVFSGYAEAPEAARVFAEDGPMQRDLKAKELALWDADLAAEAFEADMAAEEERHAAEVARDADRKAG